MSSASGAGRRVVPSALGAFALVLACGAGPFSARTAAQDPVGSIPDLAFMAGCWEGPFRARSGEEGVIEERYTAPSANLMLGTTRYLLRGRTIQFELTTIRATDEGILFHPYPGGEPSSATFLLTRVGSDVAVFEAPEHDFPRRIMYTSEGGDRLVARTDDGTEDGQAISWRMRRVDC